MVLKGSVDLGSSLKTNVFLSCVIYARVLEQWPQGEMADQLMYRTTTRGAVGYRPGNPAEVQALGIEHSGPGSPVQMFWESWAGEGN